MSDPLYAPLLEPTDKLCQLSCGVAGIATFIYFYGDTIPPEKIKEVKGRLYKALKDIEQTANEAALMIPNHLD